MTAPSVRTPPRGTTVASPAATRATRPSWRDPRLVVGVLLVCVSVVVGARVLAGADDTVPVLAAAVPLSAGHLLTDEDLETVRVRFAEPEEADRYLPSDAALDGVVLLRPVGAGELIPRAALGTEGDSGQVALPLAVDAARAPADVRTGSVVDVWAGPDPQATRPTSTRRLLQQVPVLSVDRPDGLGPGTVVQVVVGVPEARADRAASAVAGLSGQSLLVVVRDG